MNKMHIKKGDTVVVLSGKYKGEKGKIINTKVNVSKIIIEGINKSKCHIKPKNKNEKGQIIEKEMPLHVSKVMKICPECKKTTRYKKIADTIVCKKCGKNI